MKIDMTGSDKENRAFWSTSSSDSSLRSSPQTDLSASTPQDPHPGMSGVGAFSDPHHPPHDGLGGRDIVLEPVREEELPATTPPAAAASLVIRNQLNDGNEKGDKTGPMSVPLTIATGASHVHPGMEAFIWIVLHS